MILRRLWGKRDQSRQVDRVPTRPGPPHAQSESAIWDMLKQDWTCANGHQLSGKPMDLCADAPDPWTGERRAEPNSALRFDEDCLTDDFCVLKEASQTNFIIRAVMEFPIAGTQEIWGFGCWTTLSEENFDKYVDGFNAGVYPEEAPWFGWLCNRLMPIFTDSYPLALAVCPRQDRQRPKLLVRDEEDPLGVYQKDGLPPSVLLEILQNYGFGPKVN